MIELSNPSSLTEERYDAALDHLVDSGGMSYDDARRRLGNPPYELYDDEEPGRQTFAVSVGVAALGRVCELQRTDAQRKINARGLAAVRKILESKDS